MPHDAKAVLHQAYVALKRLQMRDGWSPTPIEDGCSDTWVSAETYGLNAINALENLFAAQPAPRGSDAEAMASRFHEAYERLAPQFGYVTRPETRAFDSTSANGRLMIAVCGEIDAARAGKEPK